MRQHVVSPQQHPSQREARSHVLDREEGANADPPRRYRHFLVYCCCYLAIPKYRNNEAQTPLIIRSIICMDVDQDSHHALAEDANRKRHHSTTTRCAGGYGDLFTCDHPLECTREICFPDEHWVDVTADYYDHDTGELRSDPKRSPAGVGTLAVHRERRIV